MVFPFELYCKKCGVMILSSSGRDSLKDLVNTFEKDASIDSWISDKLRSRPFRCPHCRRLITTDPLIRGDVMFGEWSGSGEVASPIIFYV
jgi:hypothetical protein